MSYLEYCVWKLIVLCVIVGVWQFWRGLNGYPMNTDQDHIIRAQRERERSSRR